MGNAVAKESKLAREFEVEKILGSGAFGIVLKAKNKFDTASYAIKLAVAPHNSVPGKATNEIKIFANISSHQNVVSYKASWVDTIEKADLQKLVKDVKMGAEEIKRLNFNLQAASLNILCIQMELCGPDLRTWMRINAEKKKEIDDRKHWKIFCQIVKGLSHIHHYNIIHRDLKPDNIFVCEQQVKIGDLGLARVMPNNNPTHHNMTANGTICYMAPEQATSDYGKSVDIYALGLILAELFSLVKPEQLLLFLVTLRAGIIPPDIIEQWSTIAVLISKMVKTEADERIDLDDILIYCKVIKRELSKDRHDKITCDGCHMHPIRGIRFKCQDCPDFDFCENCKETVEHDPAHRFSPMKEKDTDVSNMLMLMSLVTNGLQDDEESSSGAETDTARSVKCWKCKEKSLSGMVQKCTQCTNTYYCDDCFKVSAKHTKIHKFELVNVAHESRNAHTDSERSIRNRVLLEIFLKAINDD